MPRISRDRLVRMRGGYEMQRSRLTREYAERERKGVVAILQHSPVGDIVRFITKYNYLLMKDRLSRLGAVPPVLLFEGASVAEIDRAHGISRDSRYGTTVWLRESNAIRERLQRKEITPREADSKYRKLEYIFDHLND